jgi:hypothetical protein
MTNTNTPDPKELLRRLANSLGLFQVPLPENIPDSVIALCERFIEGDLDEKELADFYRFAGKQPWVMTLLKNFEEVNPGWREAQAQWEGRAAQRFQERLRAMIPEVGESWDFSIFFEASTKSMEIDFNEQTSNYELIESSQLEMAHSQGEQTAIIHTRNTKNVKLTIRISYSTSMSFHMEIELQSLDATMDPKSCSIRISSYPAATGPSNQVKFQAQATSNAQSKFDFDDLVEGGYKIELMGPGGLIEQFTMNIRRKD